jgi:hypothetical protein
MGAFGVTSPSYRAAIRTIGQATSVEKMHTHDFALEDAEHAIQLLNGEIRAASIHSCLVPELGERRERRHLCAPSRHERKRCLSREPRHPGRRLVADHVRLRLPYKDGNSNPVEHCTAVSTRRRSIAGVLAARSGIAGDAGLEHRTLDLSVVYLAAIGCDVVAEARVLRRGRARVRRRRGAGRRRQGAGARAGDSYRFATLAPP